MQNKIVIDVNQKTSRLKQALRKWKCCVTQREEEARTGSLNFRHSFKAAHTVLSMAEIQGGEVGLLVV